MKSDREFIDGIYAKAELIAKETKHGSKHKKPSFFSMKKATVFPVAAAAAFLVLLNTRNHQPRQMEIKNAAEAPKTRDSQISTQDSKARTLEPSYYVEGQVTKVLSPYMGYGRIEVKTSPEMSDIKEQDTIVVAIGEKEETYQEGSYIKATLLQKKIGTQDYYVFAE